MDAPGGSASTAPAPTASTGMHTPTYDDSGAMRSLAEHSLQVRRYREEDASAVWDLHVTTMEEAGVPVEGCSWDGDLHTIADSYLSEGDFLVVLGGEEIVAMGGFVPVTETTADIRKMRVTSRLQGRGIGRLLLKRLEDGAKELGYEKVQLETGVILHAAIRLYRSAGYHEIRRGPGPDGGWQIFFEKNLV